MVLLLFGQLDFAKILVIESRGERDPRVYA